MALIQRTNQETVRALDRADVKKKFLSAFTETVSGTPAQSTAAIKANMVRPGKLIKERNLHAD